ncbi:Acetyltransferase [Flavobacterium longum]|uniref:acetyltransferase n=1 Tax=Flavobacterium longum TaxID=1299340 RepID=UPI0039E7F901
MIIIGAKGFAKEVLEVICQRNPDAELFFYDDVNTDLPETLYGRYVIYRSKDQVQQHFRNAQDKSFTIGIGNPVLRHQLYETFTALGGVFTSTLSPLAHIGRFDNQIDEGCNIMTGTVITNSVRIGKGCLVNLNCTIGHDTIVGDFVEMSPDVNISGNCKIGNFVTLGTNATVLPGVSIGNGAVIGAGSVVTKDIPDHMLAYGVPAQIIRNIESSK